MVKDEEKDIILFFVEKMDGVEGWFNNSIILYIVFDLMKIEFFVYCIFIGKVKKFY